MRRGARRRGWGTREIAATVGVVGLVALVLLYLIAWRSPSILFAVVR
jgi:hypothetical protein